MILDNEDRFVEEPSTNRGDLEEDLKIQRLEEDLSAGLRQTGAGAVNVKKGVRTEREEVRVPRRREEVEVERVPAEDSGEEVAGVEIVGEGGEEFVVRVYEEEVVVSKRVVLKEEIRLRKRVVEEEEVVEVELRKEEVQIDDQTERGRPGARAREEE